MIHYDLRCQGGHEFDGWFRDSDAFDRQASAGLVECPACGSAAVRRSLMAPAITRRRGKPAAATPVIDQTGQPDGGSAPVASPVAVQVPAASMPDQMRAMLQRMRAEVEKTCEPVGPRFAEEARAIHRGESEARGIYGESTPEEAEALAEEGIEVARIPWVPRADG